MAYEMVMPYHLHMPSYFLETFTEYPLLYPKQQYPSTYQNVDGWILSYFYSQSLLKIKAKTSFI